jgi:hydroxyacylglutathione hydrolase
MKIHQIYTNSSLRNFTYVIELKNNTAYVIDPWDAKDTQKFLTNNNLDLLAIINTHEHWDHIQGNQELVEIYNCEVWAHANGQGKIPGLSRLLQAEEKIHLSDNCTIEILDTPGHSQAHLCFIVHHKNIAEYIFTGDILFNAGVGNCHGGSVEEMYKTIQEKFESLPDNIVILPGHDYLENNLNFTLSREPSNNDAENWLNKYKQSDVHIKPLQTTMADERKINTFFRLNNEEIINNLFDAVNSPKDVFISLRALRDKW